MESCSEYASFGLFCKRLNINKLTLVPFFDHQSASYWLAKCVILVSKMRHIGVQFASYYLLVDSL